MAEKAFFFLLLYYPGTSLYMQTKIKSGLQCLDCCLGTVHELVVAEERAAAAEARNQKLLKARRRRLWLGPENLPSFDLIHL